MQTRIINKIKYIGNKTGALNYYRLLRRKRSDLYKKYLFRKINRGFLEYPRRFTFQLTNKCNLKCKMCFQKKNLCEKELSLKEIDNVLDNLGPNCRLIYLTGGEIFMRRDLLEILDLLKYKYRKKCFLLTNGTLLDSSIAKKIFRYDNIIGIQFSLDGTREVHNRLTNSKDAFEKTLEAIKLTKDRFRVSVNCVVLKDNLDYLADLTGTLGNTGIYNISFAAEMFSIDSEIKDSKRILEMDNTEITVYQKDSTAEEYSYNKLVTALDDCKKVGRRLGISIDIIPNLQHRYLKNLHSRTLRKTAKLGCRELLEGRVNFNGDVMHCELIRMGFGNLLEKPFEEIWNSDNFNLFRKKLLENNLLPICEKCCKVELL